MRPLQCRDLVLAGVGIPTRGYNSYMAELDQEIAAFEGMSRDLEAHYMGKWVVVHDLKLTDVYESFENAAQDAVRKFGRGPYLIRQVGALPVALPASVMFRPQHGTS